MTNKAIFKSLCNRFACRQFDPNKKLSKSDIETLKHLFNLTPLSYGLQPVEMIMVKDTKLKNSLKSVSFNQQQVADCDTLIILAIRTDLDLGWVKEHDDLIQKMMSERNLTESNVVKLITTQLFRPGFNGEEWATNQAYIVLGNLINCCAHMGIDSIPMEGFIPSEVDKILNLDQHSLSSVLMFPIGKAIKDIKRPIKARKNLKEIIHIY